MTMETTKKCSKCGETKAKSEFNKHKNKRDGLQTYCRLCQKSINLWLNVSPHRKALHKLAGIRYRRTPRAKVLHNATNSRWLQSPQGRDSRARYRHRPEVVSAQARYYHKNRLSIVGLYGARCALCNCEHTNFLEIDHVCGGGKRHRDQCGSQHSMFSAILAEGYRPDKYRVLYKACNQLARWFTDDEIRQYWHPVHKESYSLHGTRAVMPQNEQKQGKAARKLLRAVELPECQPCTP